MKIVQPVTCARGTERRSTLAARCFAIVLLVLQPFPAFAGFWFVPPQLAPDSPVIIHLVPRASFNGAESYSSLEEALTKAGPNTRILGIGLGYALDDDVENIQSDLRAFMASHYPDEYASLLRAKKATAEWSNLSLRARLRPGILASGVVARITPVLQARCLQVTGVDFDNPHVRFRDGTPFFRGSVGVELAPCTKKS